MESISKTEVKIDIRTKDEEHHYKISKAKFCVADNTGRQPGEKYDWDLYVDVSKEIVPVVDSSKIATHKLKTFDRIDLHFKPDGLDHNNEFLSDELASVPQNRICRIGVI